MRRGDAARRRQRGPGNLFSFLTLMCGVGCWVPLIVVILAPLTLGFFVLAQVTGAHHTARAARGTRGRLVAAWAGLAIGAAGVALQVGLVLLARLLA